jgi:hypothetical protein
MLVNLLTMLENEKPFGHSTTRIDKNSKKEVCLLPSKPCIMFHGS